MPAEATAVVERYFACMRAGDRAAAELGVDVAATPTMHVMDLFVVADGLIRSLTYFVADHP